MRQFCVGNAEEAKHEAKPDPSVLEKFLPPLGPEIYK
jgi:hypothetical protein